MLPNYQIVVRDKNGNELGEFTEWNNLRFNDVLNNYGTCEFGVPVTSDELAGLVSMRRYETLIKKDGEVIWSGEQANRYGSLTANGTNRVTIVSHTFFEGLNSMFTDAFIRYEQVDQGAILKDLIDTFQAKEGGDLGYTFGDYITGKLRDREYEWYNLYDAFTNMANVIDGPDIYINSNKVINIVSHKGVNRSKQIILEWGTNIRNISIKEDFSTPCNEAIVLGSGFGSEQKYAVVTNPVTRDIYGLRQQRSSEIDVSINETLIAKANALIAKYKQPLMTLEIEQLPGTSPVFGSVLLGDTLRVRINEGIYNIDSNWRIYGFDVGIGELGEEYIKYTLASI